LLVLDSRYVHSGMTTVFKFVIPILGGKGVFVMPTGAWRASTLSMRQSLMLVLDSRSQGKPPEDTVSALGNDNE
jgi:hypothetical protein